MTKQKFVIYKRLSVEKKGQNQTGFRSQRMDIDLFLESVPDHEIISEFEEFVSGAADVKPSLEEAMQLCRETGATLLVSKVDRLSRRISQVSMYLEGDVKFNVASLGADADNFMIGLFALLAEKERTFIKQRVKRGLAIVKRDTPEKLAKGINSQWRKSFDANRAAGLHKQPERYAKERDAQAPLVNRLQQMMNDSNNSLTQAEMAHRLNKEGFLGSRGKPLSQNGVSHLIKKYELKKV